MTPQILMLLSFVALIFVWTSSIKRQVSKHHQVRSQRQPKPFKEPHTPAGGVAAHH